MKIRSPMVSLRTAGLVVAAGMLGAWLVPLVARAAGSSAVSSSLSFAGTLRQNGVPLSTQQSLVFAFKKNGTVICQSPDLLVTPDATGQFVASIPVANCPASLFDGSEVKIDIAVGGEVAVVDQPITSVPSAKYAEQVGFPDCPVGYDRETSNTSFIICRFGSDEVVRVGTKSSAFWIDRYEVSIWEQPNGTGKNYGPPGEGYPLPQNGQLSGAPGAYAVSKAGAQPSVSITWFQADVACRASGKRLPSTTEWGFAASGTADPGTGDSCRIAGTARLTGQGAACTSVWGAQDMIGNVSEWTAEWYASPPTTTGSGLPLWTAPWGPGYGDDQVANIASIAGSPAGWTLGVPAVMLRGGYAGENAATGVFAINLTLAPNASYETVGFRCVIPR